MTWRDSVTAAKARGMTFLMELTAVDEVGVSNHIRVVCRLMNPDTRETVTLDEAVDRDDARLCDIADIFPGAAWLQRQVHDLFGVTFEGGDNRPLIHHGALFAPLRKDVLLEQRQVTHWPGGLEPGERGASPSRRKIVPPGVPDAALVSDPDATPADIALSATGVRVRRAR